MELSWKRLGILIVESFLGFVAAGKGRLCGEILKEIVVKITSNPKDPEPSVHPKQRQNQKLNDY
jgi:hypothetical protein